MKIAIAARGNYLESPVDPHFGKCAWYYLFDREKQAGEFIQNETGYLHEKTGCEAAENLLKMGVGVAVAGRFGSKVVEVFRLHQIQMIIPENPVTIIEIINQLNSN
jgi:predicted Fe-Mo cluster-binding NifX family protein